MPVPQSRVDFDEPLPSEDVDLSEAAPGVDIDSDGDGDAAAHPVAARASSVLPEESFADIDADLSDRAPNAPVTPRRSVHELRPESSEATPPRAVAVDIADDDRDDEPEPTMVGKVPERLLELSHGDENTRAFTAPRELIELARRKRDERRAGAATSNESHARVTARPARDVAPVDHGFDPLEVPAAPAVPAESFAPPESGAESDSDGAPPVARTYSGEMEAVSQSSRAAPESAAASGPDIEIDPSSELSPSAQRAVIASLSRDVTSTSEPVVSSAKVAPKRSWYVLVGLFVLVGVVIARWRELQLLFH